MNADIDLNHIVAWSMGAMLPDLVVYLVLNASADHTPTHDDHEKNWNAWFCIWFSYCFWGNSFTATIIELCF